MLRNIVTLFLLEITYRENEIALMERLQDNKAIFSIFQAWHFIILIIGQLQTAL